MNRSLFVWGILKLFTDINEVGSQCWLPIFLGVLLGVLRLFCQKFELKRFELFLYVI